MEPAPRAVLRGGGSGGRVVVAGPQVWGVVARGRRRGDGGCGTPRCLRLRHATCDGGVELALAARVENVNVERCRRGGGGGGASEEGWGAWPAVRVPLTVRYFCRGNY